MYNSICLLSCCFVGLTRLPARVSDEKMLVFFLGDKFSFDICGSINDFTAQEKILF